MMHCFIEGPIDETFFKHLFCGIEVEFYQYANKPSIKVNQYIQTIKQLNEPYIFFADGDGASYQEKKEKILQKYSKLEPDHVFIVQFEIESWYLAGVNKVFCDKNKIKHYYNNTDSVTKEMFNEAIKTCNETKLSIMLKMLNIYDCLLADTRNTSFSSFFSKNMSICQ